MYAYTFTIVLILDDNFKFGLLYRSLLFAVFLFDAVSCLLADVDLFFYLY
jgi:hypothetical protein